MRTKTVITLTKHIEEGDRDSVNELHQSEALMGSVKRRYIEMLAEVFNMDQSDIDVEIVKEDD